MCAILRCVTRFGARFSRYAGLLVACLATAASYAQNASLSFNEALALSVRAAPSLAAKMAQAAAAQQTAIFSGELPDPKFVMGVENLPIAGPNRFDANAEAMTMRRIGIMQEFNNGAKRRARTVAAQSRADMAVAETEVTRLSVLRETSVAWIMRASVENQLARIDALATENQLLAAAVRAKFVGGQTPTVDVVLPRLEAAAIEERRDELQARRQQAIAMLRRWIGNAADLPLLGVAPDWPINNAALSERVTLHPELIAFDPKTRMLDAEVSEAQAAKRPDWALELAYQNRAAPFDDMIMLQVSVDLPIFAGARQNPQIAAKQAERSALAAEREAVLREHGALLEADLAEYQRLTNAVKRQREVLLPLAEEKSILILAAWRGGKGSLMELIAARRERIDADLKAIALEGERQQLAARLYYAYGHPAGELP
ncbi:MAG: TolC family protein [Pseudomonadota bacterium]